MNALAFVRLAPAFALAGLAGPALLLTPPASAAERPGLHETTRFDLAGSGATGAIQVDSDAKRLYVARGDRIDILDSETGAKLGAISPVPGVRALVLAPGVKRGFAVGGGNAIASFDLEAMKVVKTVASPGQSPAAVAYDPDTGHVFVANEQSGDVTVLDAATGEIVTDLPLGGKLAGLACDGFARLFVNAEDLNAIHVVDTHTLKPLGDYPTAPGVGPLAMAIEDQGRRLFVPCRNGKLVVVDGDIGATFRILKLEGSGPAFVAFGLADPDALPGDPPWKGRIVTAMGDGTLNVGRMVAFVNFVAHDHLALGAPPLGVAIEGTRQRAYVLTAKSPTESQVIVLEP
jgi:YVTN family beta-propeller protein